MIHGIGTDIIEIKRIQNALERFGNRFINKIFTSREQAYCLSKKNKEMHLAGRFAAKEAIAKALGTGITEHVGWKDIEIINDSSGKPQVILSESIYPKLGLSILVSISHCREYATAVAVIETGHFTK